MSRARESAIQDASCPTTETIFRDLQQTVRNFVASLPLATLESYDQSLASSVPPALPHQQQPSLNVGGGPMVADPLVLKLHDAQWMDPSGTLSATSLFIRPAYQVLLVLVMAFLENTDAQYKIVITGARGAGKTAFLSWVVYHLRLQRNIAPKIVLDLAEGGSSSSSFFGLIREDGSVERGVRGESFQSELAQRTTFYLCDGCSSLLQGKEEDVMAKTIVVASPNKRHVADLTRAPETVQFVMPLWTFDELEACRASCYPHVPAPELKELYSMWGGVPRWTLGERKAASKKHFMQCLAALTFADALKTIQERGFYDSETMHEPSLGYELIHMDADHDNTFQLRSAALCSSHACALLLNSNDKERICEFLDNYRGRASMKDFHVQVEYEYWKKIAII